MMLFVLFTPLPQSKEGADQRREQFRGSNQNDFQKALLSHVSVLRQAERRHNDNDERFQDDQDPRGEKKGQKNAKAKGGKGNGQKATVSPSVAR